MARYTGEAALSNPPCTVNLYVVRERSSKQKSVIIKHEQHELKDNNEELMIQKTIRISPEEY